VDRRGRAEAVEPGFQAAKRLHARAPLPAVSPTIGCYNDTSSLVRFEKKIFRFEKRSSLLCSCKLKSRRIRSWFFNRWVEA
jgi:hypothetical protein